jgi:hypothetical protein
VLKGHHVLYSSSWLFLLKGRDDLITEMKYFIHILVKGNCEGSRCDADVMGWRWNADGLSMTPDSEFWKGSALKHVPPPQTLPIRKYGPYNYIKLRYRPPRYITFECQCYVLTIPFSSTALTVSCSHVVYQMLCSESPFHEANSELQLSLETRFTILLSIVLYKNIISVPLWSKVQICAFAFMSFMNPVH